MLLNPAVQGEEGYADMSIAYFHGGQSRILDVAVDRATVNLEPCSGLWDREQLHLVRLNLKHYRGNRLFL